MSLTPLEMFQFGGVDSRSNPLNMPSGRSLRMKNWAPQDSGVLQLRYGYTTVSMSTMSVAAYHDIIPYTLFDDSGNETKYVIIGQGTNMRALNVTTGTVTSPAVRGTAFASSGKGASYLSNNHLHFGNGTDQKWFDGTTWRDNGLRSLTAAEVANVVIVQGVQEVNTASRSSVTITTTASGGFPVTTLGGHLFYVSCFDTVVNELGPATQFVGSGRISVTTASSSFAFTGLPVITAGQVKLISRTVDGGAAANFCTTTSTAATLTRSGSTATVASTGHGMSTGDISSLSGFTDTKYNQPWVVTVIDANTFTFSIFSGGSLYSAADSGTVKRIFSVAAATTTASLTLTATDASFVVNQDIGLPASGVGGAQPGYQLYVSIYNRTAGAHVGNRFSIAGRIKPVDNGGLPVRCNLRVNNLPNLSGTDSEWEILISRTGDGGIIPYVITDNLGNWISLQSAQVSFFAMTQAIVDGTHELPVRNGVIPSGLNMFARVSDRIHGGIVGKPTVYRSASEADALSGDFTGRPEQSWAPNDIDTFPTAEGLTGVFDEPRGAFYATKNHGAVFADLGTGFAWLGPWFGAGMAGKRAFCGTPYGQFWVTGHKQIATFVNGVPTPISDEYEAALLSRIGDANMATVEMVYLKDVAKRIDQIMVKALDSNNTPIEIIHDFRLRDGQSPVGQGYESAYSAPLATDFVLAKVRDLNGIERLWAGASTGQLYQLHAGADDAGTQYSADAIFRIAAGPNSPSIPELRWYGDQNIVVSIGRKLNGTVDAGLLTDFEQLTPATGGAEVGRDGTDNFYYKAKLKTPEINNGVYVRMQLASHSADGNLDLNSPPHIPLENYGRVYLGQGLAGMQRGT